MKRIIIACSITLLLTAFVMFILFEVVSARQNAQQADEVLTIASDILKEERTLLIHLPIGYDENPQKEYPVFYVLDGSSLDFNVAYIQQVLVQANQIPPAIIVGIPNTNRNRDLTPPFIMEDTDGNKAGAGDQFLAFLQKEVMPTIDQQFRVSKTSSLIGHSRAGLFAFYASLESPELFNSYFCLSPAFWRDDTAIYAFAQSKTATFQSNDNFIFLSLGEEENTKMKDGYQILIEWIEQLESDQVKLVYQLTPHANHQNNAILSLPKGLIEWNAAIQ